jgi:hypothetical protein
LKGQALEKVRQKADQAITEAVSSSLQSEEASELLFRLGEISAAAVISRNLESAVIVGLQRIRDEKKYLALGFDRFDQFLDTWHRAPMKYKRFNYLEGIHDELGPENFDLMRGSGLSYRQMKMLEAGDIVVDGKDVVIGEDRVSLGDSHVIRDLVEKLVNDRTAEKNAKQKLERKVETLEAKVERGTEENEELRRSLDEVDATTHFERALMHAINSLLLLGEAVGQLDDFEKKHRGPEDLKLIVQQYYRLSDAYGVSQPIDRHAIELHEKVAEMKPVEEMSEAEKKETFADRAMAQLAAEGFDDDLD